MKVLTDGITAGCELWIDRGRQRYDCLALIDAPRVDGGRAKLLLLESRCPTCFAPFFICVPASGWHWLRRRCDQHRQPGKAVFKRLRRTA